MRLYAYRVHIAERLQKVTRLCRDRGLRLLRSQAPLIRMRHHSLRISSRQLLHSAMAEDRRRQPSRLATVSRCAPCLIRCRHSLSRWLTASHGSIEASLSRGTRMTRVSTKRRWKCGGSFRGECRNIQHTAVQGLSCWCAASSCRKSRNRSGQNRRMILRNFPI